MPLPLRRGRTRRRCCWGRKAWDAAGGGGYASEAGSKVVSIHGRRWMTRNSAAAAEEGERLANKK